MTLSEAISHIARITPPSSPWHCTDLGGGRGPVLTDTAIATVLNAVASGDLVRNTPDALVKSTEVKALVAAAVVEAAYKVEEFEHIAEEQNWCDGARQATRISICLLALIRPDSMAALEAYRDREVAKALKAAADACDAANREAGVCSSASARILAMIPEVKA